MHLQLSEDALIAKNLFKTLSTEWDGKTCILEMKEADYNWRQMEWIGFYFEMKCRLLLADEFEIPGERIGKTTFDAKRSVNWDFKSKAIKSDQHQAILNDTEAMNESIHRYGMHGTILALCDVEYNDDDRSFQSWHKALKGGYSKYEVTRMSRTSVSRYRKTSARVVEILFLAFTPENIEYLGTMKQGRNSNGKPRPLKYVLDLEEIEPYLVDRLSF